MTRLAVPPGTTLQRAPVRAADRSWALGTPTDDGVDAATSTRPTVTCTASATPHTKGPWTEVVAATLYPANFVDLILTTSTSVNATNTTTLLDIGTGASGSEVTLVSNLAVGFGLVGPSMLRYRIPLPDVPVGTRVAVRCQSVVVSKTVALALHFRQVAGHRVGSVVTIGDLTASSTGTAPTAPGSLNTKGAWLQFTAATTAPFVALGLGVQANSGLVGDLNTLIDVGVGSAGNEVVVVGNVEARFESVERVGAPFAFYPVRVPAGSRLAVRYARSAAANGPTVILYGVAA